MFTRCSLRRLVGLLLLAVSLACDGSLQLSREDHVSEEVGPVSALRTAACASPSLRALATAHGQSPCPTVVQHIRKTGLQATLTSTQSFATTAVTDSDGLLVERVRVLTIGDFALDIVTYLSSGLIVGGLFCYVDDGQPRSTVLHLHGGLGGIFLNPDGGDIVSSCYQWAASHDRNAFVPSFRGQDGGQGSPELCLGEADDVAAAAVLLRGLDIVDPERLALVGGSMGGCVALRAGTRIPNLRAVVAIAPPIDWQALTTFHREAYRDETETRCDGSTVEWDLGGPDMAETMDLMICGHAYCDAADYQARSPLLDLNHSTNPTLVIIPGADNFVPAEQQLLWPALRHMGGADVDVAIRDRCSSPEAPSLLTQDGLIYVPDAYHMMEDGPIISGLIYLTELLDAEVAADPTSI